MKVAPAIDEAELIEKFNYVLAETVDALEEAKIRYAFIGGIASGGMGRPRATHDIDVFVRPEDADAVLKTLGKRGFRTEKTDPNWLYKGFKSDILVDVIFKSKGEIYLDTEMYQRIITAEFHGKRLRFISPEDLIIIKSIAHSEMTPGHWHDALALLTHAQIDWEYLVRRSRRAPRRILSLFLYAQSNDIWIPKTAIDQLYRTVFGELPPATVAPPATHLTRTPVHGPKRDEPSVARLREYLAQDPRINELDIQIEVSEERLLLRGEVLTEERRAAVELVAREVFPDYEIENQLRVSAYKEPPEIEEIR